MGLSLAVLRNWFTLDFITILVRQQQTSSPSPQRQFWDPSNPVAISTSEAQMEDLLMIISLSSFH